MLLKFTTEHYLQNLKINITYIFEVEYQFLYINLLFGSNDGYMRSLEMERKYEN